MTSKKNRKTARPKAPEGHEMGMNRTGIQMSPKDSKQLISETRDRPPDPHESKGGARDVRLYYMGEAEPVGSIPMPGSVKGAASAGAGKLSGRNPEVFIDKLGERLAFERAGTRLYEALLLKCESSGEDVLDGQVERLAHFREEELKHFHWLKEALEGIGADPTAVTPSADLGGVAGNGLMQIVTDPRTTLGDSIHAILIAELADRDGWEVLIRLADEMNYHEIAETFRKAMGEEQNHLRDIRQIYSKLVMKEAAIV